MSILLDDREDQGMCDQLSRFGLPLSVVRLDYGDLAIQSSNGLLIGYERKRLSDLIASMQNRRLSGHQLRGMWSVYDRVELVVEGLWRPGENGEIEVFSGRWQPFFHNRSGVSFRQVDSYLYSQYEMGGVAVWRTSTTQETVHLYVSRWHWWQKDYDLHKSHDVLFSNDPSAQRRGSVTVSHDKPSPVVLAAAQIPGIDAIAWSVGEHFSSVHQMVTASASEWRQVTYTDRKGNVKRFGKARAQAIFDYLRGFTKT